MPRLNQPPFVSLFIAALFAATSPSLRAADDAKSDAAPADKATTRAFLNQYCVKCHGPETQKAKLRFDTLAGSFTDADEVKTWSRIAEALDAADMPPRKATQPTDAERARAVEQITRALAAARASHDTANQPSNALRRLNRVEYENTVHDLLGVDVPLKDMLPEDGNVQGFDNVAGGLAISSVLMERYLEAADTAFEDVIRRVKPLPADTRRAVTMEDKNNIDSVNKKKGGVISKEGAFIDFTPGWPPTRIDEAHPIEDGVYRCRIAVWPHEPNQRTLVAAVYVGPLFGPGKRRFMGMYDVTGTPDKPRIIEFTTRMAENDAMHILPWVYPEHITYRHGDMEARPGVAVEWAETHGPLDQSWPSKSQQKLFGDLPMEEGDPKWMRHRRGVRLHHVTSKKPKEDAARIIRDFVPRAFRRPVDDATIQPYINLAHNRLDAGRTFEDSVRAAVTAVLCSPQFLLLNREAKPDDYTLASRLSYFLWSTMPDDELLQLAAQGKLSDPAVLRAQTERMIDDPRIERFVRNFTGQWLDLRDIEFTTPDGRLYPEFDPMLQESMLGETRGFFRHILENDLSVANFINSDFTVLNERLAAHYGIDGVKGHEKFRVVQLPDDSIRGGVLTHASVLKVTANGANTSPVLRGVWVLDNLLGQPAPPPPAGVPAVEPDIRGATTIREQLDKHRNIESCARCHRRIDPPGFALEAFDPIGQHRTRYRATGKSDNKNIDWVRHTQYGLAMNVDASGTLPDGESFKDFTEFRDLLMNNRDQVARAIAMKLLVYGSGRPITAADRPVVDKIVEAAKKKDLGLRSMIHAVVQSETFMRP